MPLGIEITLEGVLVLVGWATSLGVAFLFALRVIPKLAAKRACEAFGLVEVETNGRTIFVPTDLEGEPVQIPVGVTTNAEGEQVPKMGYAPLPMTLTYLAAQQAATLVHMKLLNVKSQVSKRLSKEALGQAMSEGGSIEQMLPLLPKKAQMVVALAKTLGIGGNASGGGSGTPATRSGGSRAI